MIRALIILMFLLVFTVASLLGLAYLNTSATPALTQAAQLGTADIKRGEKIVKSQHLDKMREGEVRRLQLSSEDVNAVLNYLTGRLNLGVVQATLGEKLMVVRGSLRLPGLPVQRYLNFDLALVQQESLLVPVELRLGNIYLKERWIARVLEWVVGHSPYAPQYAVARNMLQTAVLQPQGGEHTALALTFVWQEHALKQALSESGLAMAGVNEAALAAYHQHLAGVKGRDFARALREAFVLAKQRSATGDAVAENRAALVALAEVVLQQRLLSAQAPVTRPGGALALQGREDHAQHFALSAFIAAAGGKQLADAAGLYKELKDAEQGGSGFSFNDIAADMAGTRLGEESTRSQEAAARMQSGLAASASARSFFPRVEDLSEFMKQREFERRFGGVGEPAYQREMAKIEARIAELSLYR